MDLQKLYTKVDGKIVEQRLIIPNFPKLTKQCPLCGGELELTPYQQPFIRTEDGIVMVDSHPRHGYLTQTTTKPETIWACKTCAYAEKGNNPVI